VSPVKYELGFYIPEDGILHSHRRENLKSYLERPVSRGRYVPRDCTDISRVRQCRKRPAECKLCKSLVDGAFVSHGPDKVPGRVGIAPDTTELRGSLLALPDVPHVPHVPHDLSTGQNLNSYRLIHLKVGCDAV
jgi:hypothetical protein